MSKGISVAESDILAEEEKGFPHWETRLAAHLGIARVALRELRASLLVAGTDWQKLKKRVCLSDGAVKKVDDYLKSLKNGAQPATDDVPGVDGGTPPPVKIAASADNVASLPILAALETEKNGERDIYLEVYRANFLNRHLLEAHKPGADPLDRANIVRVRVGSSANFTKGMIIPCRHLELDYYELARPCPRWRGRW